MPHIRIGLFVALCATLVSSVAISAQGNFMEVFSKGSYSKSHLDQNTWTEDISGTIGLAFPIFSQLRIEGRYTYQGELQNLLAVSGSPYQLNDIKTQTTIYSVGLDVDILSDKYALQPYIYVGIGYLVTTRNWYQTVAGMAGSQYEADPTQDGVSLNVGGGLRLRIARAAAIEIEAFGYGSDIRHPNPLIDIYGTAGIRIFF